MQLVYLCGKNPKILKNCGSTYKGDYFRNLIKNGAVEWLSDRKILGEIDKRGMYCPKFPDGVTPQYIKEVAAKFNLTIRLEHDTAVIIDGREQKDKLYYYKGHYYKAKELF